jgi:(p)ppGpp synthase/HD superfamily hydrolase
MIDLISEAQRFAKNAHRGIDHRRKYSHKPYEVHLAAVAELVASVCRDPEMIAAAWLHDTVEDTPTTLADIEKRFGKRVAQLVSELTDVSRPAQGNRAARKQIDRLHTAKASARAMTIKLADLIDNCQDIYRADPGFARVYLGEVASLMEVLMQGDKSLYKRLQEILVQCAAQLDSAGQTKTADAGLDLDRNSDKLPCSERKGNPPCKK